MGIHMDPTDVHVKGEMDVGAGERQAAVLPQLVIAESWGNRAGVYVCT